MPQCNVVVSGSSDMDLLIRKNAIEGINKLPTDVLKRLIKLSNNAKANAYLSSDIKFQMLQKFL